jgi:diguanylate cyclase (GGDEF)-like protein/PAS domain S-box-containing protein
LTRIGNRPESGLRYVFIFHDITAKREAENALRKSEQRFKNLFEHAGDSIFITDSNLRIVDANARACRELGYTTAELLELSVKDVDSSSSYTESMLANLRAGQTQLSEVVKKRKDGTVFPAEVHVSRFEEDGKEFFQAIVRDRTEREEAQRKIRESEQRFGEVIEMTPAGYVLADGDGVILHVNPALCSISGHGKEELVGQVLAKLFAFCPWEGVAFVKDGPTLTHGMEAVIRHRDGRDVQVLFNGTIKRDRDGYAECMTGLMTDITERKQAESRLEQLATHDTLTGLPNRALLNERVHHMLNHGPSSSAVAVMFIDLDRFKEVNDSFGHKFGDLLLCEVARRLQQGLRPGDVIARLGGDEFVVAAYCDNGNTSAACIAQKLLSVLASSVTVGGHDVIIGASIGISMFPQDAQTNDVLFQSADTAMYRAKAAGRNSYCFFEPEMTVASKARMALELSLRPALSRHEFELHYQPRIDLKTMSVVGAEALIRWHHPELGLVSPVQFISIAEDTGLIDAIGQWVLEEACKQTRQLMREFEQPLRVSVNVSARQLRCCAFVDQVRAVLEKTGFPPQYLELELTESALIADIERTAGMLRELKNLGIKLAVDDFGTGYSGLAYLRKFPIDVLKLDRSFVLQQDEGVSSFQFIRAFVDMAHALNLSVVAEGVETKDVLDFLRSTDCDEVQGYFLARPLTLAAFQAYLAKAVLA